jgi:hypothetical protein
VFGDLGQPYLAKLAANIFCWQSVKRNPVIRVP